MSDEFVEFGRDVIARDAGEIGMHLHAWNSPPLIPLTSDDFHYQPYLMEYPDKVIREKVKYMTALLEDRFDRPMVSHRAGRIGMDSRYAAILMDHSYRVDCSVTPGIDWRWARGAPGGIGGTNYAAFPRRPYFLNPVDIAQPAESGLLEVPVTIQPTGLAHRAPWVNRVPLLRRIVNRLSPEWSWMCPGENGQRGMLRAARGARRNGASHVEFMLHSSELMPGGSPGFRTVRDIELLYARLEAVFSELATWCRGMTLQEFHTLAMQKGLAQ